MLYHQSERYEVNLLEENTYEVLAYYEDDIHDIRTRVVFDYHSYCVVEAEVIPGSLPFSICEQAMERMKDLIGLQATPGFAKRVKQLLGGSEGCIHLVDLVARSLKTALYGASRSIPEWADDEDYKERWAYWELGFQNSCLYFSQPDALKGMLEKLHNKEIGVNIAKRRDDWE